MKIYVSGPMTGYDDLNFPAFAAASEQLRAMGHEIISPAEIEHPDGSQWEDYLRRDLHEMLSCGAILMLDGWHNSKGARLENFVAHEIGMLQFFSIEAVARTVPR